MNTNEYLNDVFGSMIQPSFNFTDVGKTEYDSIAFPSVFLVSNDYYTYDCTGNITTTAASGNMFTM